MSIDLASYYRATFTFIGLIIGALFSSYFYKFSLKIWFGLFLGITIASPFILFIPILFIILIMTGMLSSLSISLQKEFYKSLSNSGHDDKELAGNIWVSQSIERLLISPIMLIADYGIGVYSNLNFTVTIVLITGVLFGFFQLIIRKNTLIANERR